VAKVNIKPLGGPRSSYRPTRPRPRPAVRSGHFPDTAKEKPQEGTVVAVGPRPLGDEGRATSGSRWTWSKGGRSSSYSKYGGHRDQVTTARNT